MKKIAFVLGIAAIILAISGTSYAVDRQPAEKPQQEQAQVMPSKVQTDSNYDGKPDRTEYYDKAGRIIKIEVDSDGDGTVEEVVTYENGRPVKSVRDTNKDGKPDVWVDF